MVMKVIYLDKIKRSNLKYDMRIKVKLKLHTWFMKSTFV